MMDILFDVARGVRACWKPIGWVFTIVGVVIAARDFAQAGDRYVHSGPQMMDCVEHQARHPSANDDPRQCVGIYLKAESDLNNAALKLYLKTEGAVMKASGPE